MKTTRINKKNFKKTYGKCRICGETDYSALHVHRIDAGKNGGKYIYSNCTVLCGSCHLKVHADNPKIIIDRYYLCSDGTHKLRIIESGEEKFI